MGCTSPEPGRLMGACCWLRFLGFCAQEVARCDCKIPFQGKPTKLVLSKVVSLLLCIYQCIRKTGEIR